MKADRNHTGTFRQWMRTLLLYLFFAVLLQACQSPGKGSSGGDKGLETGRDPGLTTVSATLPAGPSHARGFSIETYTGYKILHVKDPWQGSVGIHFKYVLASDPEQVPDSLDNLPLIEIPVERIICMSTTHIAMVEALGKTGTIIGISGSDYVSSPTLRQRMAEGKTHDVGADQALNYERIISLKPDVLISYGVTAEISGMVNRLGELGIPVILNADYLENEPLGKTEWLKFIAAFYGLDERADSIYNRVEADYLRFRDIAAEAQSTPTVMYGLPWKDAWYIPGGKSFAAAFISDAGGDFLWKDMDSHEASPINLESVYVRAINADFWINSGNAISLENIRQTEARLEKLGPYQKRQVYNNSARLNPTGGNDFWETGVMEPHLILADLIFIFHPGLLPDHKLKYYRQLH